MVGPTSLILHAKEQVEAFCNATKRSINAKVALPNNTTVTWMTPPIGHVKVNWDASVNKNQAQMGVGVTTCDHTGKVLAMFCATEGFINNPSMAEAVGAWFAADGFAKCRI
jgi:hypothetical protein